MADVYVTSASEIKSAFADGEFGKNIKDSVFSMAVENKALFAINGDFYGNSERSIVIRNGIKYRDDVNDADVCVLFTDGTMQTYSPSEYDSDAVIAKVHGRLGTLVLHFLTEVATFLKRSTQQNISTVQIHVQLSAVCRQATIFS